MQYTNNIIQTAFEYRQAGMMTSGQLFKNFVPFIIQVDTFNGITLIRPETLPTLTEFVYTHQHVMVTLGYQAFCLANHGA